MRVSYALFLLLFVAACIPPMTGRPAPEADDPRFSDVVDSEELATSFMDDLSDRLRRAGYPLSRTQHDTLLPLLLEGSDDLRIALSVDGAEDGGTGHQAALAEVEAARRRLDPRIREILVPTQFHVYDQLLSERLRGL